MISDIELFQTKVTLGGGAKETEVNEFPWAALLIIKRGRDDFICGGTLINDRLGKIFFHTFFWKMIGF